MAITLDQKIVENARLRADAELNINNLREQLRAIENPSAETRGEFERGIDAIRDRLNEQLHQIDPKEWGQNITVRNSANAAQVAYGSCRIGGDISFISTDQQEGGEFVHLFVTIAGHEIEGYRKLFLDGVEIGFPGPLYPDASRLSDGDYENLVFFSGKQLGTADQVAEPNLVAQSAALFPGKWTSDHRQRGNAGIYLYLFYDPTKFINGFPEIAVEGDFKNSIYDPRDSSTGYSNNAALCLADYLMDQTYGPGFSLADIDVDSLATAADICDELETVASGGTEKKYTINGAFRATSSNNHRRIITDMETAMGGNITWTGSKWLFLPGKWRSTSFYFSERDLRSAVKISPRPKRSQLYNGVKGLFRSPDNYWELTEYPPVANSLYKTWDGGQEQWLEVDLPFTSSASMAQRIAKILLRKNRNPLTFSADHSIEALDVMAGDTIAETNERFGFDEKTFEVLNTTIFPRTQNSGPIIEIGLSLQETAAEIYDWDSGEETTFDLTQNTTLPNPSIIAAPASMTLESGTDQLYLRSDGTVFSRVKVSWPTVTNPYILGGGGHQVCYKRSDASDWICAGQTFGAVNSLYILDVEDGQQYDFHLQAFVGQYKSPAVIEYGYTVVGKTMPPETVTGFTATPKSTGILFSWNAVSDLDLSIYELRVGASWAAGTTIAKTDSISFLWETQTAGNYTVWIRAKDTSGNYSFGSASVSLTINAPGPVQGLNALIINNMVRLDWSEPLTTSFPISHYKLYKGATFGAAETIGNVAATIKLLQEQFSGTYTYWVTAVDVHGNEGAEVSITEYVRSPVGFELLFDTVLNPASALTLTNAAVENSEVVAPIVTGRTYTHHFTDNSWNTPQDQITAGYPIYIQPSNASNGIYEQKIDYGSELAGALIVLSYEATWVDGDGTITPTISYSDDDVSYTDVAGVSSTYGVDFRYVKIKFEIDGDDDTSVVRLKNIRLRLEVEETSDEGIIAAVSTDGSGTTITTNETFLDIIENSISLTYKGSSAYFPSFTISGNTVSVFLWDTSGNRVSGDVKWALRGITAA